MRFCSGPNRDIWIAFFFFKIACTPSISYQFHQQFWQVNTMTFAFFFCLKVRTKTYCGQIGTGPSVIHFFFLLLPGEPALTLITASPLRIVLFPGQQVDTAKEFPLVTFFLVINNTGMPAATDLTQLDIQDAVSGLTIVNNSGAVVEKGSQSFTSDSLSGTAHSPAQLLSHSITH